MLTKITFKHEIKNEEKISNEEIIKILLKNRQIKDEKEFLNPKNPQLIALQNFHKSYKSEFKKVIKILQQIKEKNQTIVVYTDYDADGITGGAILWETLHLLGFKTMPYVPDRKTEGYGFSIRGIDNVIERFDPALIISVDHGITKVKEIDYAKKKGIKVIVTDHHLKQEKIPRAQAIFHIPELSGAGVSYFFAKEISDYFIKKLRITNYELLKNNFRSDYLALASIGIIADLVPLTGPARSLVKYGLQALSQTKRIGLKHILKEAGIEGKTITPYEVGFIIAPRINAVGRLENAIDALRLLCTKKDNQAFELAHKVGKTNIERQLLVEKSVEEAKTILESSHPRGGHKSASTLHPGGEVMGGDISEAEREPKLIILISDHWHEGIIGLIASKIAEEFYRPTIVLTKADGHYKGSARSIPGFDITAFLRRLKEYLVDVGGHKAAAGFTIEKSKITTFATTAIKVVNKLLKNKDLERKIEVDLKISLNKINLDLVKSLEKLQPFGIGNPRPTFYSQAKIVNAQLFGKKNEHLKIFVRNPASNLQLPTSNLELIAFSQADQFKNLSREKTIEVVYSLEINRWGGSEKLRGRIIYCHLS